MTDLIDPPAATIPRDRWGRPMVTPPGGGKPVAYTRCTTFVGVLEDTYNLSRWQQRMVAVGLSSRPDLLLSVTAHADSRDKLNDLAEQAREAAQASAAATTGTAVHALTERIDRSEQLPMIPDDYQADLAAYRAATAPLEVAAVEQFTVHDDLKIGGTPDRVGELGGRHYIADIKTGSLYGIGKIAMQLAVYARSMPYHVETRERRPWPFTIDQDRAIVIHLPAGQGECTLLWVDIAAGWRAVQLAHQVRQWRARKDLSQPVDVNAELSLLHDEHETTGATWVERVADAATVDELRALYVEAVADGVAPNTAWRACIARKADIEAAVSA